MVTALLIASTTLLAVATTVLGWLHTRNRGRVSAAEASRNRVDELATRLEFLRKEVAEIAIHLPVWRTEMESMADKCEEILDRADRKNKRAVEAEARLTKPKEEEVEDAEPNIDDLLRGSESDRELARELLGTGGT